MTDLTRERLLEELDYRPETGRFFRRGQIAGGVTSTGYRYVRVDGRQYRASRLVWLAETGEWPKGEIDHKNRQRDDNRIANLRDVTSSENSHNTGVAEKGGVGWHKKSGKWRAYIQNGKRHIHLGLFGTMEEARIAREKARQRILNNDLDKQEH